VRPPLVVVLAVAADHHSRLGQTGEQLQVQAFVAQLAVETLAHAVLPRRPPGSMYSWPTLFSSSHERTR